MSSYSQRVGREDCPEELVGDLGVRRMKIGGFRRVRELEESSEFSGTVDAVESVNDYSVALRKQRHSRRFN